MDRLTIDNAARLRGYTLPLSPTGNASFVTPPPWHFSGELLWVDFRADPDAVAAFLPSGLRSGADPGACAAVFADWQWCSDSREELADPVRCQFKECFLVLNCRFGDEAATRYPYVWVDRALPLVRGWIQGVPKLFGSIWMTRAFEVGRAGARRRAGERFAATLAADDRRLIEASVTLTGAVRKPPALDASPPINSCLFPAWNLTTPARPQLVRTVVSDREYAGIWRGDAALRFLPGPDTDLLTLAPIDVGHGYVFSYAETVVSGHPVDSVTTER